jgi:hypothetical protein
MTEISATSRALIPARRAGVKACHHVDRAGDHSKTILSKADASSAGVNVETFMLFSYN